MHVHQLINQLAEWWWSPFHPAEYCCRHPETNVLLGLGKDAMKSPGQFNIYYGLTKLPDPEFCTFEVYRGFSYVWDMAEKIGNFELDGVPLHETAAVLGCEEFADYLQNHPEVHTLRWGKIVGRDDVFSLQDTLTFLRSGVRVSDKV
jgi:hypothetical protein